MNFTPDAIWQFIADIESGKVTAYTLPESLYYAIAEYLKDGVLKGFGPITYDTASLANELVNNVYIFSAAKTYQQTKEIGSLLVDEKGNLRSSSEFRKLAREKFTLWNDVWGETEYNTAVGQAQMASKWRTIQAEKDVMHSLKYRAIIDVNTSDICRPLNNLVAPVDDPIWKKITPLNHFNCRCLLLQTNDKPTSDYKRKAKLVEDQMQDLFKQNPGETGEVFNKSHPYFDVPKKDRARAKRNFDLPLPTEKIAPPIKVAKTIKEAEQIAKDFGAKFADFGKLDISIANMSNQALYKYKSLFPEIEMEGVGSIQASNREKKRIITEAYKKTKAYETLVKLFGKERADKRAASTVSAMVPKTQSGTIAHRSSGVDYDRGDLKFSTRKLTGIYFNEAGSRTVAKLDDIVERNVRSEFFSKGSGKASHVFHHEYGHELDNLLSLRDDQEFISIFEKEHKLGKAFLKERLSEYAATAGGYRPHLKHEMIAEAWAEYIGSDSPRDTAKSIGDLMLKKYHAKYGGDTDLEDFKKEVKKTLSNL